MFMRVIITIALFNLIRGNPSPVLVDSSDLETRIKNGDEVPLIEYYPFMVSILDKGKHRCGGTIISKSVILTAAHCTDMVQAADLSVRVGSLKKDSGGSVYQVVQFERPAEYFRDGYKTKFDVALLKLESALPTNGIVKPVRLIKPNEWIPERASARAIGWGLTWKKEEDELKTLRFVDFPLLPRGTCSFDVNEKASDLTGQFCAGEQGKSECAGDSGGPLLVAGIQIGIASKSNCSSNSRPTTYTDVLYFYNWIRSKLWSLARETIGEWSENEEIYFPEQ